MGSLAAPAMAVLGDAAAGGVHVRLDNLGTLSLCGGHFRWNGYRNAWLCDRRLADEVARGDENQISDAQRLIPDGKADVEHPPVLFQADLFQALVTLSMLPSGSLNQATCTVPSGRVKMP